MQCFKKIVLLSVILISIVACKTEPKKIDPNQLQGTYKVDLSTIINQPDFMANTNKEAAEMPINFLKQLLKNIEIKVAFYPEQKAAFIMDEKLKTFLKNFSNENFDKLAEFDYKILNDTVLHIKSVEDSVYYEKASITKMGTTYDSLLFSIVNEKNKDKKLNLVLRKIEG